MQRVRLSALRFTVKVGNDAAENNTPNDTDKLARSRRHSVSAAYWAPARARMQPLRSDSAGWSSHGQSVVERRLGYILEPRRKKDQENENVKVSAFIVDSAICLMW